MTQLKDKGRPKIRGYIPENKGYNGHDNSHANHGHQGSKKDAVSAVVFGGSQGEKIEGLFGISGSVGMVFGINYINPSIVR